MGFGLMRMMPFKRSPMRDFEKDGFVVFRSVLQKPLLNDVKRHVDWLYSRYPDVRPERLTHPSMVVKDAFWYQLISDKALLDIAELFVGPNIALFATGYISKPPYDGRPVFWHQDGSYWPLEPMNVVTLWVAVDRSLPENGCMRVIPGTHKKDLEVMRPRTDIANHLNSEIDPSHVNETQAIDVQLEPGDVSVHHPNLIHGSLANTSPMRRCGLVIRYISASTKIMTPDGKPYPTAYLLRGKAVPGINIYNEPPRFDETNHMAFRSHY
jgi:phytanoyl-CoA hydroxylase